MSVVEEPVKIAYCSEHGLHGQRDTCFECGAPAQQIPMVQASRLAGAQARATTLEKELRGVLDAIKGVGYQNPKLNRAIASAIRALPKR